MRNHIDERARRDCQRSRADGDVGVAEAHDIQDQRHGHRLFRELGGDLATLPSYFVNALEMSAHDHLEMMAAVQPYIDTSISKTVNVPADYPFDAFKDLYFDAWRRGSAPA
jgi:ribonucleoside-diphosphate reductase alpha chain